jgi:hypothetical protein
VIGMAVKPNQMEVFLFLGQGEPVVGLMTSGNAQLEWLLSLDVQALSKEDFTMDVAIKIYPTNF